MKQKKLANWLKVMIVGVGICGVLFALFVLPMLGKTIMALSILTGLPCYLALWFSWEIMSAIAKDESFTVKNAEYLKKISFLATVDVVFLLAWNVILFALKMSNLNIFLVCLLIDFMGVVIAVIFAALSHLVGKAAVLQEQSDYTI